MDLEHYDEFGNYIGPELPDSDSEESVGEEPSEMPLVPTGVVEEGTILQLFQLERVRFLLLFSYITTT